MLTKNRYRQTILSNGDLTVVIQNTFKRPDGQLHGEFSIEVWHVIMTSPHFDSGIYRRENAVSYEAAIETAFDQFNEEFGCVCSREELEARLKRIDF